MQLRQRRFGRNAGGRNQPGRSALTRRQLLAGSLAGGLGLGLATRRVAGAERTTQPNIVFLLADDLGYADLSCYGRNFSTPRIDSLARQGALLTQAYSSSAVCSPTRVALITGRYPARLRVGLDEPLGAEREGRIGLPTDIPTLPSLLRKAGYRTSLFGKWHLGKPPDFGPLKSGYDRFFGMYGGYSFYFGHGKDDPSPVIDGERILSDHGYLTDLLAEKAIDELQASARASRPVFMSLHFNAVHWPWEGPNDGAKSAAIKEAVHNDGGSIEKYREMLESLDRNVGRVIDAVEALGLARDTIVIFTSDNGGERFSDMWPLTGMKGELLEGGIRVPLLVSWPGRISAGLRSSQLAVSHDWLPTLLAAAGAAPDPDFPSDGENLLPVLTGESPPRERALYWRYKANDQAAVRAGDWKYLRLGGREHLFNLAADPRERVELRETHAQEFERLKRMYDTWNAQMPPYPADARSYDVQTGTADRY
jgi:arylsulfatase A-like enzyme